MSLKFHAILLARSGVMGFVIVERERVVVVVVEVFVKINEMTLKVPSKTLLVGF